MMTNHGGAHRITAVFFVLRNKKISTKLFWSFLIVIGITFLFGSAAFSTAYAAVAPTRPPKPPGPPMPFSVVSIIFSPSTVKAKSEYVTAKVTLSKPAPAGGQVIRLLAAPNANVQLPVSITINENENSGSFGIMTSVPTTDTKVAITATPGNNGFSKTAYLTLLAPPRSIIGFTITPASVVGGNAASGKVTISGPAPANGQSVYLTCGADKYVACPNSLNVPSGANSVTFDIQTKKTTSEMSRLLSARLLTENSAQLTASLTLTPPLANCSCQASCTGISVARETNNTCAPEKNCHRCGFLWTKKCCSYTPLQCCVAKSKQNAPLKSSGEGEYTSIAASKLMTDGNSYECQFTIKDAAQDPNIIGTFYNNGKTGQSYAEIVLTVNSKKTTYVVSDGKTVYSWAGNDKKGTKMTDLISVNHDKNELKDKDNTEFYKCRPWKVDNSKFTIPADIKFSDFSQIINSDGSTNMCAVCDEMPDAQSKASCEKIYCK